jgi:nucleotide-binding universal stress UspA family protein
MTISRILVAVDDSPAALAAVRAAVEIAHDQGACLSFAHVVHDGEVADALRGLGHDGGISASRSRGATALLRHVHAEADAAGVHSETDLLEGEVAAAILRRAREWDADLVVLGRSGLHGVGRPYVGTVPRSVLEFSETPVLVVPQPA